jgi:hypothetical protein
MLEGKGEEKGFSTKLGRVEDLEEDMEWSTLSLHHCLIFFFIHKSLAEEIFMGKAR